ncbi:hypothetical protein [Streptomyces sp. NBC_00120]|uniref:hypothetical protein n=1 Tax=Streptomyces sp. NBC_00120 TaxID=2975660 RepID=UPI002251C7A5|nr:hypothetical protein [Streptomyces sp. NBC_00120]MCX5326831.1 intracellular growth attenuator family protein [Streptomyces sp. NBC_00120]
MADEDPGWANALTREDPAMAPPAEDERAVELLNTVEELRARQARGEIRPDIDVGALSLVFFAASIAPVVLPWIAREFTQQDPTSQEFVDDYADQLARIVAALDNVAGDEAPAAEPPGESGS